MLTPLTIVEFLQQKIPPAKFLLSPWLEESMTVLVAGEAGVGKSHFAYWLASAVASGGEYLGWKTERRVRVGLLDGEMRDSTVQSRLLNIVRSTDCSGENMLILTRDMFSRSKQQMPHLRDSANRKKILELFDGVELLVVDNLNCFFSGGNENQSDFWDDVERFMFECRDRGIALLMVHHASKSNSSSPAGNSKNERLPEVVIVLTRGESVSTDGAEFTLEFRKMRGLMNGDRKFQAKLEKQIDGSSKWIVNGDGTGLLRDQVISLRAGGLTQREVGERLGISHTHVGRLERDINPQMSFFGTGD